ncbi:MAG: hypothetical protein JO314_03220 [Acidobacteria bacterium]|nr:hypothetical protein [Acidobacteriota bacterium]
MVRIHPENGDGPGVEPVRVEAASPHEAAEKATGRSLEQLAAEDQHKAIAVVTRDEQHGEHEPRYFG